MKLTNNQHIELLDSFISKHTDYDINKFTGGSVSNTLTHNNTQIHYKINLYFGYKNNKPITKTIEIDEDIYAIMYKSISLKVKSLISKNDKLDLDSIKDLMGLSSSSTTPIPTDSTTPTNTNTTYLPTINTNTNTIESDFNLFWKSYPKKKAKQDGLKAFNKAYKDLPPINDLINIINMNINSKDWIKDDGKFIPHPASWLNGKRWQDEINIANDVNMDNLIASGEYDPFNPEHYALMQKYKNGEHNARLTN